MVGTTWEMVGTKSNIAGTGWEVVGTNREFVRTEWGLVGTKREFVRTEWGFVPGIFHVVGRMLHIVRRMCRGLGVLRRWGGAFWGGWGWGWGFSDGVGF